MICERCGNEMADNALICPYCGTATSAAKAFTQTPQPPTHYGSPPQQVPLYQQGYSPQPAPAARQPVYGYGAPVPPQTPGYAPAQAPVNYPPGFTVVQKNNGALIAELILSLFGVFGVGWLMAGETTVGVILLICSFVLYWPFVILGTILTFGFGLICIGPLAIGAIVVNVILFNSTLDRKATPFVIVPLPAPPPQQY